MDSREDSCNPVLNVDIVQVVEKYISLKKSGSSFIGLCPFHKDNSPSLSVSSKKKIFKCFACNQSGNVINFVMKFEKISYEKAIKKIGEIVGKNLSFQTVNKIDRCLEINAQISEIYHKVLFGELGQDGKDYLKSRCITENVIEQLKIGFSPEQKILENILSKKGITESQLNSAGLVSYTEKGECYPYFQHKITFPICDEDGNTIGFIGRNTPKSSVKSSRYLISKESNLFQKANLIYRLHKIDLTKPVLITEGIFDLASALELGFPNTVSLLGTSFNNIQNYLKIKEAHLCLDSDAAGITSTTQIGLTFILLGSVVKVISLQNNDLNSLHMESPAAAQKALNNPLTYWEWLKNTFTQTQTVFESLMNSIILRLKVTIKTECIDEIKEQLRKQMKWELEISVPTFTTKTYLASPDIKRVTLMEEGSLLLRYAQQHPNMGYLLSVLDNSISKIKSTNEIIDIHNQLITSLYREKLLPDRKHDLFREQIEDALAWMKSVYRYEMKLGNHKNTDLNSMLIYQQQLHENSAQIERVSTSLFTLVRGPVSKNCQ